MPADERTLACLAELERKVLWLATWMVHHANHVRPKRDGLKVGGHQASSASLATLMSALYFHELRPEDRVAVKPHASPAFHAIQYLLGRQSRDKLERFRAFGGAQSYPSRTKDADDVDFSTGSVGLGPAVTCFAALVQDYLASRGALPPGRRAGRMVALVGDAELDEGNVFECLLESWKHQARNVWWIVDYNRQSLDAMVPDALSVRIEAMFAGFGWRVVTLKYGRRLQAALDGPGGPALRAWIDGCPNSLYGALVFKGGAAFRERIAADIGQEPGVAELLAAHDDAALHALVTNLGGHDMGAILDAFASVDDDRPTCFLAYTIKGWGLPLAGHKDNHAGLLTPEQIEALRAAHGVAPGDEWEPFAGARLPPDELRACIARAPFAAATPRRHEAPPVALPAALTAPRAERMSTQEAFGRLLRDLAREHPALADHVVTASPDVTVSTNLGPWVNARGLYARRAGRDVFRDEKVLSPQLWASTERGQHIELGIAENNLFLLLGALGLSAPLHGHRLFPIGTVYDPFIGRGLDALNYACYSDARFIVAGTPSGLTLAPEGGAHQSVVTPLVGIGQPGLTSFEPAFVDELAAMLLWSFGHLQARDGGAVYLRLSTRPLVQPERPLDARAVVEGGYWLAPPGPSARFAIACAGPVVAEARDALEQIREDDPDAGLLVVTSPDRLHAGWRASLRARMAGHRDEQPAHVERLLAALSPRAGLITVLDGHPASLSWLGAVRRQAVVPLGVESFGQSGDIPDLYGHYGLDADAIVGAAARLSADGAA